MVKHRCTPLLALLVALLTVTATQAALIAVTDPTAPGGSDNVTQDTATGLDWLDLTSSGGISYNDIELQFGTGGSYEGWRHATGAEVTTLITVSAGLPLANVSGVNPLLVQFANLVGVTQVDAVTGGRAARGRFDDSATGVDGNLAGSAFVAWRQSSLFPDFSEASVLTDQPVNNSSIPTSGTGHWLVRDTVPEPGVSALALLGAGWLGLSRRRGTPQK